MSETDNEDLLIGTITIHRYLAANGQEDYITVQTSDNGGEELALVEAFGLLELTRMQLTAEALGIETPCEDDD